MTTVLYGFALIVAVLGVPGVWPRAVAAGRWCVAAPDRFGSFMAGCSTRTCTRCGTVDSVDAICDCVYTRPRAAAAPGRISTWWKPTRIGPGGVDCDGNPWPIGLGGRLD